MRFQTELLAFSSVLGSAAALYDHPAPPAPRAVRVVDVFDGFGSPTHKRSEHDGTLDLSFTKNDEDLVGIDLGSDSFAVHCNECTSSGSIITAASFPSFDDFFGDLFSSPSDIFKQSALGLTFNGIEANIDLNISASAKDSHVFPLFKSETPVGIDGPGFTIGLVFQVDIVVDADGEIETEGGFKVSIPDGSTFRVPLDSSASTVANFDGSSVSLIPAAIDADAKVTVTLRLTVQAGVQLPDLGIVDATCLAGVMVDLPEVIMTAGGDSSSDTCKIDVSAELDINAGAFVDIGAAIDGFTIGAFTPTAVTTLFAASTGGCFDEAQPTGVFSNSARPTAASFSASSFPAPSSSVAARALAVRKGNDITLTSLEVPVTRYIAGHPAAAHPTPAN